MSIVEILAVSFGLIYIFFSVQNKVQGFFFAILSCSLWAYADFVYFNYKFDGVLQLFYVLMAFIGMYLWRKRDMGDELHISNLSLKEHLIFIASGIFLTIISVYGLRLFTDSDNIWLDASTTVFSILATFLLIGRKIDNWPYFLICNIVYVYLFYTKQAYGFALLMMVYAVLSIIGYTKWDNIRQSQLSTN